MNAKVSSTLAVLTAFLPALAGAVTFQDTLVLVNGILNSFIPIFITIALLAFFWGIARYLMGDAGKNKDEGIKLMIWSIVALFVMVSVWGLIRLLQNTFKVTGNEPIVPKGIQIR